MITLANKRYNRPMVAIRNLGEECPVCEDGVLLRDENKREKFCSECHVVLDKYTFSDDDAGDEWDDFFAYRRSEYSGFYGPNRAKFAGGFSGIYDFEEDF